MAVPNWRCPTAQVNRRIATCLSAVKKSSAQISIDTMFQNGSSSSIAVSRQKVTRRREPLLAVGADKGRRTQPQLPIRPESLLATTPSPLVPGPRSNTAPEKEKERTSTPLTRLQVQYLGLVSRNHYVVNSSASTQDS